MFTWRIVYNCLVDNNSNVTQGNVNWRHPFEEYLENIFGKVNRGITIIDEH